jgi:hypothetical protein
MIALLIFAFAAAQPPLAQPALSPLAPFVGHCWSGDAPGGAGTDTHCFETAFGGEHIRDRHTVQVSGKTVYAGETIYSVEQGGITFTYWNSLGGVGHGTAQQAGDRIAFQGQMRDEPSSATQPMHATWIIGAENYQVVWPDGTPHLMKRAD